MRMMGACLQSRAMKMMGNESISERDKNMIRCGLGDLQLLNPCGDGGEDTLFI